MLSSCGTAGPESELAVDRPAYRRHEAEALTYRFVASLRGHVAAVYRVSWSSDSRMLVSASKDSTLKVRLLVITAFLPVY